MDPTDIAIYAAIPACTGFLGYAIGLMRADGLRKANDALHNQRWAERLQRRVAEDQVLTIGAERDALLAQAERTHAKLSEAGRAGAIKSNAARAERRKVASVATVRALAHADLRPRDAVVAGVAQARQAKKVSGGAVASKTGG
jgi:hypothetical protein